MPTTVATGQLTIVDTNDARPITAYIQADTGVQQIYSKDNDTVTFVPSWMTANGNVGNRLDAKVFMGGVGGAVDITHQLTNRKFTLTVGGTAITTATTSTSFVNDSGVAVTNPYTQTIDATTTRLAVKGNLLDTVGQLVIYFEGDYTDQATGLTTHVIASISLNTIKTGTNAVYINMRGNNIVTESNTATKNVVAMCADLVRSSGVDTTNLVYRWYEQNGSVQISQSTAAFATKYGFKTTAGGASPTGSTSDLGTNVPTAGNGNAFNTIVISENAITGIAVLKVAITDTADNRTWENWFTVFDVTDPYTCRIISSSGDKLQNGQGSTTLTPQVFNGSNQVSDLTGWTFTWYFYDRNGKRGAFVDTAKISTAGGAPITANGTGASATFTYSGTSFAFAAGDIIKCVKPDGSAFFYEVASSTTNVVTIRTPVTNTWLNFTNFPAPSASTDFVGGDLFGCTTNGVRTSTGANPITVTGDEIDVKGTLYVEASRP